VEGGIFDYQSDSVSDRSGDIASACVSVEGNVEMTPRPLHVSRTQPPKPLHVSRTTQTEQPVQSVFSRPGARPEESSGKNCR